MRGIDHYQMHTGNPIAGWISLVCGIAALVIYVKYIRAPKRPRPARPASVVAPIKGARPSVRARADEASMRRAYLAARRTAMRTRLRPEF